MPHASKNSRITIMYSYLKEKMLYTGHALNMDFKNSNCRSDNNRLNK